MGSGTLDPISIIKAEELLRHRMYSGSSIIAATHDLWWAERFADQVVMISKGQIVLNDFTENIVTKSGSLQNRFMEVYGNAN